MADSQPPAQAKKQLRGVVKQVLSGDAVVLQGPSTNGPPKEVTVYLSNVVAPRLGKRPTEGTDGTADEQFAWDAREALRKKIVGKTVVFVNDFTATSGREHGRIYLGGTGIHDAENIVETMVSEGWLEVRPGKQADEYVQKLLNLQEQAKSSKAGRWSEKTENAVRTIKWVVEDPRALVEQYKHKPIDAVIEQVRDGSTVRAFLLPNFEYVTVSFSGVKAPGVRVGSEGKPEEYGEEARFFVESRLLQRDVQVVLEGVSNQNFVGTVLHPRGNISELLLREGFAKCVEWSIGLATAGPAALREAERHAKERRLRLWRNYAGTAGSADRKTFQAKVVEIGLADSISVEKDNGEEVKIYFSSVRAPKREGAGEQTAVGRQFRPLYDIPHMFEAREFLRKRLVGKRVNVTVDYIQPKSEQFPEKTCCTVIVGNQNIAEALVARGLAKVVRHRGDDENRSSHYDALLGAEAQAEKGKKGLWADQSTDKAATVRVQELQGDAQRSKQFLPYLQRSQRSEGVVEFVSSGSRLRVYVPKETCIITFLLGGISCPRGPRMAPGGKPIGESEPFAEEALKFTRSRCLQHEVQLEVESMDKAGGFIGYLFVPTEKGGWVNLSELLVENGLATVHFTAERSSYFHQLSAAEKSAKNAKRGLWKNHVEEETTVEQKEQANDVAERKVNYQKVIVTEVYKGTLRFAAQTFDDGPAIEALMGNLQNELRAKGITGSYTPRRGELAAAIDGDNVWNRVRIDGIKGGNVECHYVDFGNRETLQLNRLAALPAQFQSQPPGAREYQLALVQPPNVEHYAEAADAEFQRICYSVSQMFMNVEYKVGNISAVSLLIDDPSDGTKLDVGKYLVSNGFALAEQRREKRLESLVEEYVEAEKKARRAHLNIWEYGDFTGSEV